MKDEEAKQIIEILQKSGSLTRGLTNDGLNMNPAPIRGTLPKKIPVPPPPPPAKSNKDKE